MLIALGLLLFGGCVISRVLVVVSIHTICTLLDLNDRLKAAKANDSEPKPIAPSKGVIT